MSTTISGVTIVAITVVQLFNHLKFNPIRMVLKSQQGYILPQSPVVWISREWCINKLESLLPSMKGPLRSPSKSP